MWGKGEDRVPFLLPSRPGSGSSSTMWPLVHSFSSEPGSITVFHPHGSFGFPSRAFPWVPHHALVAFHTLPIPLNSPFLNVYCKKILVNYATCFLLYWERIQKENVLSIHFILTSTAETLTCCSPRAPNFIDEETQKALRVTDAFIRFLFFSLLSPWLCHSLASDLPNTTPTPQEDTRPFVIWLLLLSPT